ncbi:MAG TPA: lipoprotein insertase outer membrane protein LolB [Steroidobacteraceae bacterium]|jgi:outer membrane lipoprotein LolB|nr:lipoprotein insertase outer membrane protein LolB [Steroidobacteraceae bacterium]
MHAGRARVRACRFVLAISTLVLSACATVAQRPAAPQESWPERRAQLQALPSFQLKGRVGVATGGEGFNGNLTWQQQGPRSTLVIQGPLGVGAARVVAEGDSLSVTNSRGAVLDSDQAHTELSTKLGFDPPISSLRYWILGVPDPSLPANETLGAEQRLAKLAQGGWEIQYPDYMAVGGQSLPRRVSLSRNEVRVRLFVDDWHD